MKDGVSLIHPKESIVVGLAIVPLAIVRDLSNIIMGLRSHVEIKRVPIEA